MKTFSRLTMFVLVCFGLILIGNVADVHAQGSTLEIGGETGSTVTYKVGGKVTATFVVTENRAGKAVELMITGSKGLTPLPVTVMTDSVDGGAEVTAIITTDTYALPLRDGYHVVSITATWEDKDKKVSQEFLVEPAPTGAAPVVIVVNPPDPKSPHQVGSTFKQKISIENRDAKKRSTLPLSAWQMDVVFNPSILKVVGVEEGDFLESDGVNAAYLPMPSPGRISVSQTRARQVTPPPPKVKAPSGIPLASGDEGTLLTITFKVLAFAEETLGIHNVQLQSDQDNDKDGILDRISYSILVVDVLVATEHKSLSYAKEDVNQDETVNILDLVMVAGSIGSVPSNPRTDVNGDGFVNVLDIVTIYTSDLWGEEVPAKVEESWERDDNEPALSAPSASRNVSPATIQSWIDLAQVEDDGSDIFDRGIANLEALLASQIPSQTKLLLNYPNPFNPETWIPYQLAKATDVTMTIHSMNGSMIRTLALGHQAAGIYKSKSQAAYWDGRNEFGEQVASGLYFYTLTAGKFSATGKMLIRK